MAEGYGNRVRTQLLNSGCTFVRHGKGDHDMWYSPVNGQRFPVAFVIKSRHTANAILKQAGLAYRFR